ncbi:hypothetical protein [Thermaurantiacus sp.]
MLALLAAATLGLAELPPQALPPGSGCAIFLWTRGEPPRRIAMLAESRQTLRLMLDGRETELPRLPEPGAYGNASVQALLDLRLAAEPSLPAATMVTGVLRLERAGGDELAIAVGGLRACR